MSTEIGITKNNSFTSFWGGNENGKMVQVTGKDGYVEFTMLEAVDAVNILVDFIKEEATRRQELLKKEVEKHKEMEKTIFKEIADFDDSLFALTTKKIALDWVNTYCPQIGDNHITELKEEAR